MNMLSKVSYCKICLLTRRIWIRNILNDYRICSDDDTYSKNTKDVLKITNLVRNLNSNDKEKLSKRRSL